MRLIRWRNIGVYWTEASVVSITIYSIGETYFTNEYLKFSVYQKFYNSI